MKDLIIGNPYTAQTALTDKDQFLILACDGVSRRTLCLRLKKGLANSNFIKIQGLGRLHRFGSRGTGQGHFRRSKGG
jgi:hypothetical protein